MGPVAFVAADHRECGPWVARWEGGPSPDGFTPFGGWKNFTVKQYIPNQIICGMDVDLNWHPDDY